MAEITRPNRVKLVDHTLSVRYPGRILNRGSNTTRTFRLVRGVAGFGGELTFASGARGKNILPGNVREIGYMEFMKFRNEFNAGTFTLKMLISDTQFKDQKKKYLSLSQLPIIDSVAMHANKEWQVCTFRTPLNANDNWLKYGIGMILEGPGRCAQVVDITSTAVTINPPLKITPGFQFVEPITAHIYLELDQQELSEPIQTPRGVELITFQVTEGQGPTTGSVLPENNIFRGTNRLMRGTNNLVRRVA